MDKNGYNNVLETHQQQQELTGAYNSGFSPDSSIVADVADSGMLTGMAGGGGQAGLGNPGNGARDHFEIGQLIDRLK